MLPPGRTETSRPRSRGRASLSKFTPCNPYRRENVGSLTRDSLHFGQEGTGREGGGKVEQKSIKFDLTAAAPDGRSLETREAKSERVNGLVNPRCKCTRRRPKISSLLTANVVSEGCYGRTNLILLLSLCPSKGHVFLRISLLLLPLPSPSLASAHLHRSACCLSARLLLSPVVGAGVES